LSDFLGPLLQVSLILFMGGSLLEMGLSLQIKDATTGLADLRFGVLVVLLGFVLGPAVAMGLAWLLHLEPAYASGLVLLGLTPCAPFLSTVVERAGGDKTRTAVNLLIAAVGTILLLPVAVPAAIPGLTVDAWTIAQPLLFMVFLPLALGMLLLRTLPVISRRILPAVKAITTIATVIMLALCAILYSQGFIDAVGTRAIAAQILFFAIVTATAYACGSGLAPKRRSVLTLGICTRNVGAALAPLFAASGSDERTVVMIVLGVPLQLIFAFVAARWLAGQA
jgi:BASS family bile acid:Na+ symporter